MAKSDILLLILGNSPLDKHASPGKLYDYLGIGKPILAVIPQGVTSKVIEETGIGTTSKPNNIEHIIESIYCWADIDNHHNLYHLRQTAIEQYDIKNKVKETADVLEKTCR